MRIVIKVQRIVPNKIQIQGHFVRFYNQQEVDKELTITTNSMFFFSQEKNHLSPLSNDIKLDSLKSTSSQQQQLNRHYCNHPDCTKVNRTSC